jgi:ParB family chromosome partitioning protein
MVEEHGYTQEQLARIIGKGRTTVTESLSLAKLPEAIKEECRRADHYPRRLLVEIAKQASPAGMVALFEQVKQRNLKSDGLRKITRAGRPGSRRPGLQIVIERIERLTPFLERVRLHTLPEEDQARLFKALRDLKRAMDGLLE